CAGGKFRAQLPQETELGLEINVVRQFQVLDETSRLHVVGVAEDKLLILRGRAGYFAEFARPKRAVHQRYRHSLALALPERKPVAARETRSLRGAAGELVDHLAFGQHDRPERNGKADLLGKEFDFDFAVTYLSGKGVIAAVTALGRIGERKEKA